VGGCGEVCLVRNGKNKADARTEADLRGRHPIRVQDRVQEVGWGS